MLKGYALFLRIPIMASLMEQASSPTQAYPLSALLQDIGGFLKPYRWRYAGATVLRFTGDIVNLYPAYATAQIVTFFGTYQPGESLDPVWMYLALAGAAFLLHICGKQGGKMLGYNVAERVSLDAQFKTLQHLCRLDLSWHDKENSGNKLKRMQKGGEGLDKILRIWITNFIEIGVNFIGITLILFSVDRRVCALFVAFLVGYYLLSIFFIKRASDMSNQVNISEEQLNGVAFEALNNIRSVKVLGMADPLLARIRLQIQDVYSKIRQRIFWFQSRVIAMDVFSYGFFLAIMIVIALGIAAGQHEIGFLVLFTQYFRKVRESIEELSMVTLDFVVAKYGIARMKQILKEPVMIDTEEDKKKFPTDWKTIDIRLTSFAYHKNKPILHNVAFTIKRGEKIGIVGVSGAGKSTLFKLLLKEHEQYEGEILIGDTSLTSISRSSLFRHTAVVLQDTEVFNFPLRDNITMANADEADNETLLEKSIHIAHVSDFLHKLPQGLDTYIGEKGVKLSGGEKQRVGIARAVFKQPDILFLDEATSHLDLESEEKIRDSLHQFFQEVTAIVIAHRLSTIKEMDTIIVMEEGRIIESGNFEELYAKKGRFHELWEKQKF